MTTPPVEIPEPTMIFTTTATSVPPNPQIQPTSQTKTGHAAKKVRLREREEDPPPPSTTAPPTQLSYRAAVTGTTTQPSAVAWPDEELLAIDDGDIKQVQGKFGVGLELSQNFRANLDKKWEKAVVVKLLGRRLGFSLLQARIRAMWNPQGPMKIVDLEHDFYLINFVEIDDYLTSLTKGPWIIAGHVLSVQPWTSTFRPSTDRISHVASWVCFPELSMARYHPAILTALGNLIDRTVKIDENTQSSQRGKFARVAVELDISSPLRPVVELDGEIIKVAYEGLPSICLTCGMVGHASDSCPTTRSTLREDPAPLDTTQPASSSSPAPAATDSSAAGYGPWVQVQRRTRRPPSHPTAPGQDRRPFPHSEVRPGSRFHVLTDMTPRTTRTGQQQNVGANVSLAHQPPPPSTSRPSSVKTQPRTALKGGSGRAGRGPGPSKSTVPPAQQHQPNSCDPQSHGPAHAHASPPAPLSRPSPPSTSHATSSSSAPPIRPPSTSSPLPTLNLSPSSSSEHVAVSLPSHAAILIPDPAYNDVMQEDGHHPPPGPPTLAAGSSLPLPLTTILDNLSPGQPPAADVDMQPEHEPSIVTDSPPEVTQMDCQPAPLRASETDPVHSTDS
ncbi:hypothetical protein K2173_008411 [Erythroxylum novogranatense]|uniref:CCHC-type domain-containing protein n=1 Tax=Erythroxylum novogranatense TaxID=1862640 RepID=A0AAV8UBM2_9ROSI|nr:hypothetical protein K2173_008411 [Erythroxylum novogranatense]